MIRLTMSAPGKNALGTELMTWITEQVRAAKGEPLLITGAGDAFSAGLNLKEVASLDRAGMERYLDTLETMVDALYNYPGPTVAWINGHAIAGGCVVALCCDHRVVAGEPKIRIGLNEVALGLQFPPKVLAMTRRRVPPFGLERVLLEAALHAPEMALRLGLVDQVVPVQDALVQGAEEAACAHLERIAAHPRAAYVATKRALREGALTISAEDDRYFRDVLVPMWCAPEVKARVTAALKR